MARDGTSVTRGTAPQLSDTDGRSNCGVGVVMDLDDGGGSWVVQDALDLLSNLEHRGTTGAEENTGDGAGIKLQIPHTFFQETLNVSLPEPGKYAVGTIFFPQAQHARERLQTVVEKQLAKEGLAVRTWRSVPTNNDGLGPTARENEPAIWQVLVTSKTGQTGTEFDRQLYVGRRVLETHIEEQDLPGADRFYVVSLDRHTIDYKGLLKASQLPEYYPDLQDDRVGSTFAMVHARFSTNTLGAWHLAHPYRRIIHNGEFNTIQGNINWMRARETDLETDVFDAVVPADDRSAIEKLTPVIDDPSQSDTASVDNALELLMAAGRDLPHALRMLLPEAWRHEANNLSDRRRAFYDYHASLVEPWDGPALVAATDGTRVGAVLDRNGLRPCRYDVLDDGTLVMASEAGALSSDPDEISERGRLKPGQCFLADPEEGRIIPDEEVFDDLVDERYANWVQQEQVQLSEITPDDDRAPRHDIDNLQAHQVLFGYTQDELEHLLEPMAETGTDPIGSMGDDTPLSVLAQHNRPLFSYFKQLFAQVTNPPLDYLREEVVTSLETRIGTQRNLLAETPAHARQLVAESPILTDAQLDAITSITANGLSARVLDATFDPEQDLETAMDELRVAAADAARDDVDVLVLSDTAAGADRLPIPSLLAVSGVHHHLVRTGLRTQVGLVVESADPRTVHQHATLIGYGADAINPYLAYRTVEELVADHDGVDRTEAIQAYSTALEKGVLKTMSKMGISTVESYQGAQIFEAVGLSSGFIEEYFTGTPTRTEGIGIDEIEADLHDRFAVAFEDDTAITRQGEFEFRSNGISHQWNPTTTGKLQRAVRTGDYDTYTEFATEINDQNKTPQTLRGLLTFDTDARESVPLEDVEPVEAIVTRFETAAMSLGSISPEAHETLAEAMNSIGANSNTGEGGEPPERFHTETESKTKQIASGRFGVTSAYLSAAEELQIKMAQGSKPGEGGHLPGEKVNDMIAHVRYATPGVGLISPPPLHDIYSIEDLKQLIYDLKAGNPTADINVKLVAEDGIGTIAAGVAKANADVVHISGHSGGTGASPKTSIKHAGLPWELGVAEANRMLQATGLRSRIKITTDGGLKTGRDVAVAALLGAEGYVFGTGSLVSEGCVMARQCHENTCPVGVATQREKLRERFPGEPDHVINYMQFIAQELRERMAELGFRTLDAMIGRTDLLEQRDDLAHPRAELLDVSSIVQPPADAADRIKTRDQTHAIDAHRDWALLDALDDAIETGDPAAVSGSIDNTDRAVGAILSHRVSETHGPEGLPDDTIRLAFDGTAGQSFGAFLAAGLTLSLTGTANDYVGKGLSGGKLIVRTPPQTSYVSHENILIGNVALYGATGGELYVNGRAGERFAVRNSGVTGVVEGVGDHGCEYMTGGAIVVLGATGKNFAAGMSGGIAYVYDPDGVFSERANTDMVTLSEQLDSSDRQLLRRLVTNHAEYTDSDRAQELLTDWDTAVTDFVRVLPDAYAEAIAAHPEDDVRTDPPAPAVSEHMPETSDYPASSDD